MLLRIVRWVSLLGTSITLSALAAHVLELPNKLALDGHLWLAIQQNLYRGWGPFIGPVEVTAIVSTWALLFLVRNKRPIFGLTLFASLLLSAALMVFFALTAPVNKAFAAWTPETLPPDWPVYRLRWEIGHAISFVLTLGAFVMLLRAFFLDAIRGESRGGVHSKIFSGAAEHSDTKKGR